MASFALSEYELQKLREIAGTIRSGGYRIDGEYADLLSTIARRWDKAVDAGSEHFETHTEQMRRAFEESVELEASR